MSYLRWIEPNFKTVAKKQINEGFWLAQSNQSGWKSWAGYAFESICYKHLDQIRCSLKIDPGAHVGTWRYSPRKKEEDGVQIDLLFDRMDGAITICEIKNSESPFVIDKSYAQQLTKKIDVFKKHTRTKKQIFIAMITTRGLKPTIYSEELISQQVILEDLFTKV